MNFNARLRKSMEEKGPEAAKKWNETLVKGEIVMSLTLENLNACFDGAKEQGARLVAVMVTVPGSEVPEVIINEVESFDIKQKYYNEAYDENLKHKNAPLEIIAFTFGNTYVDIENDFYELAGNETIYVDNAEVVKFAHEKTGVDEDTIQKIFDAESDYLKTLGIVEDVE